MNAGLYGAFLGLIVSGLVIGYSLSYVVSTIPIMAPANHNAVANNVAITDTTTGENLHLKYMAGVFSLNFPSLSEFPTGHNYAFSRWEWDSSSAAGGVECFMIIAGPGIDGKTYGIEISRKCWDALTVTVPGGQSFVFPQVTQVGKVSDGYVSFEYIP